MPMTPRQCVQAAVRHQPADRVPYHILVTGESAEEIKTTFGVDHADQWLNNDVEPISMPWWGWNELGPDWRQPGTPTAPATVIGRGSYEGLADRIKAKRDTMPEEKYFLVMIYGSHFEKANSARSIEHFLCDMARDPDFARELCRKIIDKNMVMLENFLNLAEIDGVLLGSDWGSQRGLLFSVDMWDDFIRPGEQREYDLVHSYGKDVWIHSCGKIDPLLPRLVEMGVDVLNPIQPECMDLATLKAEFGADLTFWGGISTQQTLPAGTPDEVRDESRRVRELMARGSGYIFSPAQAIQGDVPLANIQAVLDIAREVYPLA